MLKIITSLTLLLFGMLVKGQGMENRATAAFSKAEVQNHIKLIYTENPLPPLEIESKFPNQIEWTKVAAFQKCNRHQLLSYNHYD